MPRVLGRNSVRFALAIISGAIAFAQTNTSTYTITTFAGGGFPENIPATSAYLGPISAMAVDPSGIIYLALTNFNVIERVGQDGVLTRVAGNGTSGSSGDGGPATQAQLGTVSSLAAAADGDLYIADSDRIRKVSGGTITTVAGGGMQAPGSAPLPGTSVSLSGSLKITFDGNGNVMIAAVASGPEILKLSGDTITLLYSTGACSGANGPSLNVGIAVGANGNIYLSFQSYNIPGPFGITTEGCVISFPSLGAIPIPVTPLAADSNGILYYDSGTSVKQVGSSVPVAGNATGGATSGDGGPATQASLNGPWQLAFDGQNNLYILQNNDYRVRKVSNGIITTVAGTDPTGASIGDGGPAVNAQLYAAGAAVGPDGSLYVADSTYHRIRKITNGIITTVAGIGVPGYTGDGGPATAAKLNAPKGVAVDNAGNVYIADTGNNVIREITNGQIKTVAIEIVTNFPASPPTAVAVSPSGNLLVAAGGGAQEVTNGQWNQVGSSVFGPFVTILGSLAIDGSSNLYAATNQYGGDSTASIAELSNGVISDIGRLPSQPSSFPVASVAVDRKGNVYATADTSGQSTYAQQIYRLANGNFILIAGGGTQTADGIPALSALITSANVLAADEAGRVYLSENGVVRVLLPANVSPPSSGNCTYAITPSAQSFAATGGSGTISITTDANCIWNVETVPAGVILTSALSGTGSGTVSFQVLPNSGVSRDTSFLVAGQAFVIEQESPSPFGIPMVGSLAQMATGGGWVFTEDAVNLGSSSATARFNFSDNAGNPLSLSLTSPQASAAAGSELAATLERTINPNAQVILQSTGAASTQVTGSGQVQATGQVSGFGIFSYPALGWNAVVPMETRNAARYYLVFDNTGPLTTGIAIANLAGSAAGVGVIIRDDTGTQIGTGTISLAANGHASFMLNDPQLGFPVTNGKRGTIEFDSPPSGQISVLGLRANGGALTTLPVLASSDAAGGAIAHATYNGGFTSVFYIVNTGTNSAPFTLSFFDENGNPLSAPLLLPQTGHVTTSVLTQTLAPGAMLVVQTIADDQAASVVGSAQLTTTGSVGGFEIYRWTTFGQEASVPLETRTPGSYLLVFDDTNGLTTGVALSNVGEGPVNVPVNIYDDTGNLLAPSTINLAGRGHTSFMLPDSYSSTSNQRGMVEFVVPVGGKITAIGLRAKSDGTLTTIPVLAR